MVGTQPRPFYFLNRLSLFSKNRPIYLFSQDLYITSFSGEVYAISILTPRTVVLIFANPTPTLICLSVIINFNIFFPVSLFFFCLSYPPLPKKPLKMTWNPFNRHRTCLLLNIFERIRRVPQQIGGPYLKET